MIISHYKKKMLKLHQGTHTHSHGANAWSQLEQGQCELRFEVNTSFLSQVEERRDKKKGPLPEPHTLHTGLQRQRRKGKKNRESPGWKLSFFGGESFFSFQGSYLAGWTILSDNFWLKGLRSWEEEQRRNRKQEWIRWLPDRSEPIRSWAENFTVINFGSADGVRNEG